MDAVKSGQYQLSEGIQTDFFIDIPKLLSNKRALDLVCDIIIDQFKYDKIDTIVSTYSLGSSILGNRISGELSAKLMLVKDLRIKPTFPNGERVLVLVDVLITGYFAFEIIKELERVNSIFVGMSVLFLRNQEIKNCIEKKSLKMKCILNFSNLFPEIHFKNKYTRIDSPPSINIIKKRMENLGIRTNQSYLITYIMR